MKFIKIDQGAKITYINPANIIAIDHTLNEDGGHNLTFHCNNGKLVEVCGLGEPMDEVVEILHNHSIPAESADRDKILESDLEGLLQDYSYHHIIYKLSQLCEKKSKATDDDYAKAGLKFRWLSDTLTI